MKVQQLAQGFWAQEPSSPSSSSTLTISFKRLRPLAPKFTSGAETTTSLDVKQSHHSSPKANCTPRKPDTPTVETHSGGGTRWNPTQEQIAMLEALYRGGMRTPNAHQIERITAELGMYGRIEGKNVFYWFQNHKARERQKQKRSALLALNNTASSQISTEVTDSKGETRREQYYDGQCKRKCRSWSDGLLELQEDCGGDGTLELFPLHPEMDR